MDRPLLTVGIPTFNRAERLRSMLWSLAQQPIEGPGDVEFIVSDNCSTDHTSEVVAWAQQYMSVRYHRNSENVGLMLNWRQIAQNLARGEFCWTLGDDDILRSNALERMCGVIRSQPDIDCFIVNYNHVSTRYRKPGLTADSDYDPGASLFTRDLSERRLERWEDMISLAENCTVYTYIGSQVVRTSALSRISRTKSDGPWYASIEDTFPHVVAAARHMVGKPAYYIGDPQIVVFHGEQEWGGDMAPLAGDDTPPDIRHVRGPGRRSVGHSPLPRSHFPRLGSPFLVPS